MDLTKIIWILPKLYGSYHGSRRSSKNPNHIFKIIILNLIFDIFEITQIDYNLCNNEMLYHVCTFDNAF
jgi:hypothetical protein